MLQPLHLHLEAESEHLLVLFVSNLNSDHTAAWQPVWSKWEQYLRRLMFGSIQAVEIKALLIGKEVWPPLRSKWKRGMAPLLCSDHGYQLCEAARRSFHRDRRA